MTGGNVNKRDITRWVIDNRSLGYAFAAAALTYCGARAGSADAFSAAVAVAGVGIWDTARSMTNRLELLVADRCAGIMIESNDSLFALYRELGIPFSEDEPPENMKLYGIVARIDQHIKEIGSLPLRPLDGDKSAVDLQNVIGG